MEFHLLLVWALAVSPLTEGGPNLLFATSKDLLYANAARSSHKGSVLLRDIGEVSGMNFCFELGLICWSDRNREIIQCAGFNGTTITSNKEIIVKSYVNTPEGLACDWVTKKLYWTDGEADRVEVISLVDKHKKVLFWDDIDQPRSIALVPQKRIMFWTDWGEVPKIERAGMDGSPDSRKAIVTEDIFWPNGLTIDYDSEVIYWVDGKLKFIAVMDYDGGKRRKITPSNMVHPYGIAYFRNKLYWTDWGSKNLFETDVSDIANSVNNTITRKVIQNEQSLIDVRVYAPERQPPIQTPCSDNNGGCSHLCLLSPNRQGFSCACPTGIKLISDFVCANASQEFLIVAQRSDISKISLDSPDFTIMKVPLHGLLHTIAVDYDPLTGDVYWTDDENRGIRKATMRGTQQKDIFVTDVEHPDGIAIDWISRNLFWTDTGTDRIEVANLQGQYRKVLVNKDLREPRGIAVAPVHGLIFWSDWNEEQPKVERANMDGTDRRVIAHEEVAWPNGVALDLAAEKIFWCDAKTDKIESCNFDGSDRRVLISDRLSHPFGLSLLGDYLYWTDWSQRSIERVNRFSGEREVIADQIANVMDVRAVRLGSRLGWNPCAENNGGCNHLCLNKPGHKFICACQIEFELAGDMKTCVRPGAFLLFARDETIGSISIENNNNDNKTIPVTHVVKPSDLALDKSTGRIFWADTGIRAITHAFINGSDVEKVVEFGLVHPEGIAVDWISKNLYWADSSVRRIEVSRLDGTSRRVLLWRGVDQPKSIALDPMEGFMYWTDWGSSGSVSRSVGSIMRAAMDGSRPTALISNIGRSTGLSIDYKSRKLYWTSARPGIEVANLDGSHWRTLISTDLTKPTGLAQFQDRIYWSDWETGAIETADKNTGGNRSIIETGLKNVVDIIVYQNSEVQDQNNCSVRNGGCSHLCFPLPGRTYTCGCPLHYTLAVDNLTCNEPTSFLLFSQRNSISRLLPDTSDCPDMLLPIHGLKVVRAIAFDPVKKVLFWIDGRSNSIKSGFENTGKQQTVVQVHGKSLHDIVFDPFSRFLFWSCSSTDVINATRVGVPNSAVHTIVKNDGFKPRDLALHPGLGFLLWVDVTTKGRVVRSRLDGSNATVIFKDQREVDTLTVDPTINRVFVAVNEQIFVCDLGGQGRKTLIREAQAHYLAVLGNHLYWVSGSNSNIIVERANKFTGEDRRDVLNRVTPTDLISVTFPSDLMYQQHPCSHVNKPLCSHICLPVETKEVVTNTLVDGVYYDKSEYFPRENIPIGKDSYAGGTEERMVMKAECACPLYQMLESDGRTCTDMPECSDNKFVCSGVKTSSNKDCVPIVFRCDGQKDCPDGSDERGCPSCGPGQFRCVNGQCIDEALVCDHESQCLDGSDEAQCCQHGEFMCSSTGECIPSTVICDGHDDCPDGSDEVIELCQQRDHNLAHFPDKGIPSYVIVLLLILSVALLLPICYCFHRRLAKSSENSRESSNVLLSPKPFRDSSSIKTPPTQVTLVSLSMFNSSTSSKSYDRNHITGASSSSTSNGVSCAGAYPAETLNPPPSPATIRTDSRRCCGSSGSRYRPYRHYRAINQPPPPTPCETDVCDESDYGYRPQTESEYMSYSKGTASECDSDPFPPPPTPSSCPPSPSSTYWNPLPPPPSPVSRHHH